MVTVPGMKARVQAEGDALRALLVVGVVIDALS